MGKVSFGVDKLQENLNTLMDAVIRIKLTAAKGTYIKSLVRSTTMGPGVKFNSMRVLRVPNGTHRSGNKLPERNEASHKNIEEISKSVDNCGAV